MKAEIVGEDLVIRIPLAKPYQPSKSGKTTIIASSSGNQTVGLLIDGKPLVIGLNAYVAR